MNDGYEGERMVICRWDDRFLFDDTSAELHLLSEAAGMERRPVQSGNE